MIENELTINGKEYVLKGSDKFILPTDEVNVMAILFMPDVGDAVCTPAGSGGQSFKKTSSLKDMTTKLGSDRATTINGTSIGVDYVAKATSIEKILGYHSKVYFDVWERVDKDGVVLKDHPVILRNGKRGYLIAPRIVSEDEK